VKAKIRSLQALLPSADAVALVVANPLLLGYNVRRTLAPKLAALAQLLPGADISVVVTRHPGLLCNALTTTAHKVRCVRCTY
jgi:hypothetical protein